VILAPPFLFGTVGIPFQAPVLTATARADKHASGWQVGVGDIATPLLIPRVHTLFR
jgi:hypothetical protein